jgi:hypothetical protein
MNATSTILGHSSDLYSVIWTGVFSITGAVVGGLIGIIGTYLTLRSNHRITVEGRLFETRKITYEKTFATFTHAISERINGRVWPTSSTSTENREANNILASVSIFSTNDLVSEMSQFFKHLSSPIPTNPAEKQKDTIKGNIIWQKILNQMKKDLGIDPAKFPE